MSVCIYIMCSSNQLVQRSYLNVEGLQTIDLHHNIKTKGDQKQKWMHTGLQKTDKFAFWRTLLCLWAELSLSSK